MADEIEQIFKIIVAGKNKVGKTCLTQSFTTPYLHENTRTSLEVDIYKKTITIDTLESQRKVTLQIWVLGSQESFNSLRKLYYEGTIGFILVFDLTNRDSFKDLVSWTYELLKYRKRDTPVVLVGNKRDLVDKREVAKNEIELFRKTFKLEYFETSAKTGKGVDDAFYTLTRLILANRI
jgi:small GTP-binding protein